MKKKLTIYIAAAVLGIAAITGVVWGAKTGKLQSLADQITGTNSFQVEVRIVQSSDGSVDTPVDGKKDIYFPGAGITFGIGTCTNNPTSKTAQNGSIVGSISDKQTTKLVNVEIKEGESEYRLRVVRPAAGNLKALQSCDFSVSNKGEGVEYDDSPFDTQAIKISNPVIGKVYQVTFSAVSGDTNLPIAGKGNLNVKIKDSTTSELISGTIIRVSLYQGDTQISDSEKQTTNGTVEYSGLPAGNYSVVVNGEKCFYPISNKRDTTVSENATADVEVTMTAGVSNDYIKFNVTVLPKEVNPEVQVKIFKDGSVPSGGTSTTDTDGRAMACIQAGDPNSIYLAEFTKTDWQRVTKDLGTLSAGSTIPVNATMSQVPKTFDLTGTVQEWADGNTGKKIGG